MKLRLLHTADWHLGKKLLDKDRLAEQIEVLEEMVQICHAEKPDLVVIAGDIFDTFNPSNAAMRLFYQKAKEMTGYGKRPVFAIAGNHDSPERLISAANLATDCGLILQGFADEVPEEISFEGYLLTNAKPGYIEIHFAHGPKVKMLLSPYANEYRLKRAFNLEKEGEQELNRFLSDRWAELSKKEEGFLSVLIGHLFCSGATGNHEEEPDGENSILYVGGAAKMSAELLPNSLDYVAFGHLHRAHSVSSSPNAWYSGSPLAYSFSEAGQQKFVNLVTLEEDQSEVKKIPLKSGKSLQRKRFKSISEAHAWLEENPNALLECAIESDQPLFASDLKGLYQSNQLCGAVIPIISSDSSDPAEEIISLDDSLENLFSKYFQRSEKTAPSDEFMDLFRKLISEQKEQG